ERVLAQAPRALDPLAIGDELAGGPDLCAVARVEGAVDDRERGGKAPAPFRKRRAGSVVADEEPRAGRIDEHHPGRPRRVAPELRRRRRLDSRRDALPGSRKRERRREEEPVDHLRNSIRRSAPLTIRRNALQEPTRCDGGIAAPV